MDLYSSTENYNAGDIVYVMFRNPHTPDVASIQQAAVVQNPEQPNGLALFVYETFYPLSGDIAVYSSAEEAEQAYQYYFGDDSDRVLV